MILMFTLYKLGKTFGPAASFSGYILILSGILVAFQELSGLILLLPGAFLAFSDDVTTIDEEGRKIRYGTRLFGLFETGKWMNITDDMCLIHAREIKSSTTYSRSNRVLNLKSVESRIFLCNNRGEKLVPIMRIKNKDEAVSRLAELSVLLKIKSR